MKTKSSTIALNLSNVSSEKDPDSPTLFTIAQEQAQADSHGITNESITSFEDIAFNLEDPQEPFDCNYSPHENVLEFNTQVTNHTIFDKLTKRFQEDQQALPIETKAKRRKKQICVEYKKMTDTSNSMETRKSLGCGEAQKIVLRNTQSLEDRKSLTYQNPIAIIQDLDVERSFNMTIPIKGLNSTAHLVEDLRLENMELKQQLKQQQILFESKKYSLKCKKEALAQEITKYNTKIQLLEQENTQLAKKNNVASKNAETFTAMSDFDGLFIDKGIQSDLKIMRNTTVQTDSTSNSINNLNNVKMVEKLKEEASIHLATISKYEKERAGYKALIEKQQQMLAQWENEKNEIEKCRLAMVSEMQIAKLENDKQKKGLASSVNEFKEKVTNLETENKVLAEENGRLKEEIAIIDEQPEALKEMTEKLSHYEQLHAQYEQSAKDQKKLADEYKQKLDEMTKTFETYKTEGHKQSEKIRELKKERDQLKMDNLKQRQLFTEKCESYREIRAALRRKLKQKDDMLLRLQRDVDTSQYRNNLKKNISQQDELPEPNFSRPKSLENTGKHALKDLAATLHLEELSGELKKKIEATSHPYHHAKMTSERTPENIGKAPITTAHLAAADKANLLADKSFYSDDTGIDCKVVVMLSLILS